MKLKICGLNNPENINEIAKLNPDFIGFIFYPGSKRYVANNINYNALQNIPNHIKRIGVFVNEDIELIQLIYNQYELDYVQLHGHEDQAYCAKLFLKHIPIIKAFNVDIDFNFRKCDPYAPFCSYFLFDTKGEKYGGNGKKFEWSILDNYDLKIPFLLSGGIQLSDVNQINQLRYRSLIGIDINSGFELEPGIKDVERVNQFKQLLNSEKTLVYEN